MKTVVGQEDSRLFGPHLGAGIVGPNADLVAGIPLVDGAATHGQCDSKSP